MRKATLQIDDELVARAGAILGMRGLKATVRGALEDVVARDARERFIARLRSMNGLDLDDPQVMAGAWR